HCGHSPNRTHENSGRPVDPHPLAVVRYLFVRLVSRLPKGRRPAAVAFVAAGVVAVLALVIYTVPAPSSAPGAARPPGASEGVPDSGTSTPSGSASARPSASAGPAVSAPPPAPPPVPGPGAGWTLMWSPDPQRDGLRAFEGVEDDRANTDPAH